MPKSIKDKVQELEVQNRFLTDNLVDSIWVLDAETLRYEFSAPPFEKFSGYSAEERVGQSIFDELTPESSEKATELLREEIEAYGRGKHTAQSLELELVHKNGHKYWVEIRAKLLAEADSPLKIFGITKDITARKKAQQQLENLNKKLEKALSEKERLLSEVKVLQGLIPICSGCKRIRDDEDKWWPLETYIKAHTDSDFTHSICPDCKDVIYPEMKRGK